MAGGAGGAWGAEHMAASSPVEPDTAFFSASSKCSLVTGARGSPYKEQKNCTSPPAWGLEELPKLASDLSTG